MNKIDANCTIGTWVNQELEVNDETQFLEALDYYRIDRAIVSHVMAHTYDPIVGNERLLKLAAGDRRLIPCPILAPHYKYHAGWPAMAELLRVHGIKFARLAPKEHGYALHSPHTREMFAIAERLGIHLLLGHAEITDAEGIELPGFELLLRQYPGVNVIVTGTKHRRKLMLYGYLESYPNVYAEFSLFDNWLSYQEAVGLFGSERLVWGSNMPFNMPGSAITMLSYANISAEDKANIAYHNIARLMGE
ncbi:amidohydrolase family protein [Paenibacillus cymbidii]|uniref:amidohydrolase family protein n=1 Tax=Paenibacillus cymbidii TaxID=1639034 RepID=UPI0010802B02|nr:amidohydrolase family protein [Paenibacillus cymbidii]